MKLLLLNAFIIANGFLFSQDLNYVVNKGQWNKEAIYMTEIYGGRVFIKQNSFLFDLYDLNDLEEVHHHHADEVDHNNHIIDCHAYEVNFLNASFKQIIPNQERKFKHNYFIGDKENWASNVNVYGAVLVKNVYTNIDLNIYSSTGKNFKYDFIVHPSANTDNIILNYKGVNGLSLRDGNLIVKTSFNEVIEQKPYVFQIINGEKMEIKAEYILNNDKVTFNLGEYDKSKDLIIDPTVIASTYSGSTATIYGHTATFDTAGNIYSAGAGFSPGGLPITPGAYQTTYGGSRDMCINKYNKTGSSLIYATYLGGTSDDYPHSLIDYNNNLCILGTSRSTNFPTTAGAYDQSHNGLSDIVVSILNPTGSILMASTYVGGSSDDGLNNISTNYGDTYRGEIVTDDLGNVYVSSVTESANFPTSVGAYQTTKGTLQDGVALKLSSNLSTLAFSTFLGAAGDDACYGIKVNGSKTYVSGTAASAFLPVLGGAFSSYSGQQDGYVLALDATASSILHTTYFGSSSNEQAFFVEIDRYDDIYILGQTDGTVNATAGVYDGGNRIFVSKFSDDLTTHLYTSTTNNLAPVAFLVDNCDYIYVSGHGSLTGFDITPNAIQSSPAGFYLMALEPGAVALNFGTYYGSSGSHVDGGTSRFDKKGVVYQATCTSSGFPTLPSAFSPTNSSPSYDVTVFKIDFELTAQPAEFGPFPNEDSFVFDTAGCFDIVAFGGYAGAEVLLDVQSDAFQYGAYTTLPTQKPNGLYDFTYFDTNTNNYTTAIDFDVIQNSLNSFEGVGNVGARFCWNPDECLILAKDQYNVKLTTLAIRCDSTIDSLVRNITLEVTRKNNDPFVPNVFSPNGDGNNDFYKLPESEYDRCYDNLNVKIYNRWGTLVFETNDPLFKWDGKNTNGKLLEQGTYYCVLEGFFGNENVTNVFPVTLYH